MSVTTIPVLVCPSCDEEPQEMEARRTGDHICPRCGYTESR